MTTFTINNRYSKNHYDNTDFLNNVPENWKGNPQSVLKKTNKNKTINDSLENKIIDDSLQNKIDKLTRNEISKTMNVPPEMVSKSTTLYKNEYNKFKTLIENNPNYDVNEQVENNEQVKNNEQNESLKHPSLLNKSKNNKVNNDSFNIKGNQLKKQLKWLNLPNENDLEKLKSINPICNCLVSLYKSRYIEIQNQLLELKEIVNDIDKYSNYKFPSDDDKKD